MGQDTCIYVHKKDLNKIEFSTVAKIDRFFSGRWNRFQEKFKLGYSDNYMTLKDFCKHISETDRIKEEFREIFIALRDCDGFIQGDYQEFPKDRIEKDYVDLTIVLYELWNKFRGGEL
jgi:hypothetical protein